MYICVISGDTRPDSTGLDWKNIHKNTVVQSNKKSVALVLALNTFGMSVVLR